MAWMPAMSSGCSVVTPLANAYITAVVTAECPRPSAWPISCKAVLRNGSRKESSRKSVLAGAAINEATADPDCPIRPDAQVAAAVGHLDEVDVGDCRPGGEGLRQDGCEVEGEEGRESHGRAGEKAGKPVAL